jgi:protein associated with RNAse G/E
VVLVPHDDWWLATFYDDDPRRPVDTYVDITTPAEWTEDAVTCVDLDLDVVRRTDGSVFVDDEDEFEEHQHSLGYPSDVIASARASAAAVLRTVDADEIPFNRAVAARWIAKLRNAD